MITKCNDCGAGEAAVKVFELDDFEEFPEILTKAC